MNRAILLDIEGTTSSVSFVYETLFPFAKKNLRAYLEHHWEQPDLHAISRMIIKDAGIGSATSIQDVEQAVLAQMAKDAKLTGLKELQGRIWKAGFESGKIKSHVYSDTPKALECWKRDGVPVFIYSSGSVEAQKLLFAHTIFGDLTDYLNGYFDTTYGGKRESSSYRAIAREIDIPAADILFISDVEEELNAARSASMKTALAVRGESPTASAHQTIRSLDELFTTAE